MKVGFIGWRGMVGSVLISQMRAADDFSDIEAAFFSTSNAGGNAPPEGSLSSSLLDANDITALSEFDALVSCQGSGYTKEVYPKLRASGWNGYWIDAASALRMADDAIIVLDPVNRGVIDDALERGVKTFVGGNCTVSLMIMALAGLFRENLVQGVHSSTYQAASGAGARAMIELMRQMAALGKISEEVLSDPACTALTLEEAVTAAQRAGNLPSEIFTSALAGSLLPWIDCEVEGGLTREEWKGNAEANKILQTTTGIPIDGICVRVGALRCHSQAFLIQLTQDVALGEIEAILAGENEWVSVVENSQEATLQKLTPTAVTGTLDIPIGRIRKSLFGTNCIEAFSVGDQLLWGAAEPVRRMLRIVHEKAGS